MPNLRNQGLRGAARNWNNFAALQPTINQIVSGALLEDTVNQEQQDLPPTQNTNDLELEMNT